MKSYDPGTITAAQLEALGLPIRRQNNVEETKLELFAEKLILQMGLGKYDSISQICQTVHDSLRTNSFFLDKDSLSKIGLSDFKGVYAVPLAGNEVLIYLVPDASRFEVETFRLKHTSDEIPQTDVLAVTKALLLYRSNLKDYIGCKKINDWEPVLPDRRVYGLELQREDCWHSQLLLSKVEKFSQNEEIICSPVKYINKGLPVSVSHQYGKQITDSVISIFGDDIKAHKAKEREVYCQFVTLLENEVPLIGSSRSYFSLSQYNFCSGESGASRERRICLIKAYPGLSDIPGIGDSHSFKTQAPLLAISGEYRVRNGDQLIKNKFLHIRRHERHLMAPITLNTMDEYSAIYDNIPVDRRPPKIGENFELDDKIFNLFAIIQELEDRKYLPDSLLAKRLPVNWVKMLNQQPVDFRHNYREIKTDLVRGYKDLLEEILLPSGRRSFVANSSANVKDADLKMCFEYLYKDNNFFEICKKASSFIRDPYDRDREVFGLSWPALSANQRIQVNGKSFEFFVLTNDDQLRQAGVVLGNCLSTNGYLMFALNVPSCVLLLRNTKGNSLSIVEFKVAEDSLKLSQHESPYGKKPPPGEHTIACQRFIQDRESYILKGLNNYNQQRAEASKRARTWEQTLPEATLARIINRRLERFSKIFPEDWLGKDIHGLWETDSFKELCTKLGIENRLKLS